LGGIVTVPEVKTNSSFPEEENTAREKDLG
jgi:hypothetical protein